MIEAPDRELRAENRLVLGAGIGHRLKVFFCVQDAVRPWHVAIDIRLPLGVRNHEVIEMRPLGPDGCRVTFN